MILALDIGNTNITIGVYDRDKLVFTSRIATDAKRKTDQYAVEFMGIFYLYGCKLSDFEGAIISSVVPSITSAIADAVKKTVRVTPLIVGPGIKTGLNIAINDPAELGANLLAMSVAALNKYPLPNAICDLGTASTISVLNKNGNMIGGMIYPGVRTSFMALVNNTAQLPQISYNTPKRIIGRNTVECMQSGLIFGASSVLDGMLNRVEDELGMPVTAIATGEFSADIVCNCKHKFILDETLVLKGLKLLYEKNKKD